MSESRLMRQSAQLCRLIEEAYQRGGIEYRFSAQAERVRDAIRAERKLRGGKADAPPEVNQEGTK